MLAIGKEGANTIISVSILVNSIYRWEHGTQVWRKWWFGCSGGDEFRYGMGKHAGGRKLPIIWRSNREVAFKGSVHSTVLTCLRHSQYLYLCGCTDTQTARVNTTLCVALNSLMQCSWNKYGLQGRPLQSPLIEITVEDPIQSR